ncbi:MAG: diacylglycerol kinase family protein [Acidobacteriota bacterium]
MRPLVLVNRGAGSGRGGRAWVKLREQVPQVDDCDIVAEGSAAAAQATLAERLADGTVERLVSIGGDGTAQLAVGALLDAGRGDIPFAIVPAGTGSDFAHHLGVPKDPAVALREALEASHHRPLDAVRVEADDGRSSACLNIASAGLSGAVDQAVEAARRRGGGSYLLATLRVLATYGSVPLRVTIAAEPDARDADAFEPLVEGPLWLVAMANGSSFGDGMRVAPDAVDDDGMLDVIVVPPVARWRLPWLLPRFLRGTHVHLPEVTVRRAGAVRIEPLESTQVYDVDGEVFAADAVTVRILPSVLRLLT